MAGPEKKIQKSVVEWARREFPKRLIARKFQSGTYGTNGWEDYEFLIDVSPFIIHVEFKAAGGKCTDLQLQRHKELREIGHHVIVVDNADVGKGVIRQAMRGDFKRRTA